MPHEAWLLCRPVGTGWGLCVTVCALGSRHADQNLAFHVATLFSGAAADPGHTCTLFRLYRSPGPAGVVAGSGVTSREPQEAGGAQGQVGGLAHRCGL